MSEVRSKVGTLTRPSGRGYSAPTILAVLCLLAFTACSAPQSTSSTRHYPSGQNWTSSVATRGVSIEATDVSGVRGIFARPMKLAPGYNFPFEFRNSPPMKRMKHDTIGHQKRRDLEGWCPSSQAHRVPAGQVQETSVS